MRLALLLATVLPIAIGIATLAACGEPPEPRAPASTSDAPRADSSTPPGTAQQPGPLPSTPAPLAPRRIEHEDCDTAAPNAKRIDLNGDGRADVTKVFDHDHETCRASDLDFDGTPDVYEYFAPDGSVRRVERDLDGNGHIDQVVVGCVSVTDRNGDGVADASARDASCKSP